MAEYTPTIEQLEDGYAHDPEAEYRDPVNYGSQVAANRRAFRRGLEVHDREVAAKALTDAADEMEDIISRGEGAETFAFPPGTTGLGEAIRRRDSLLEDPVEWLCARAAALGVPEEAEHG